MQSGNFKESYSGLVAIFQRPAQIIWLAVLVIVLVLLPFLVNKYLLTLLTQTVITVIGIVGLNILVGGTGLISLGHAGFIAVGAYANAILISRYGIPPVLGILLSGVAAALVSFLVSIPSLRLRDLYLAITTLAFSLIVVHVILMSDSFTHGSLGMMVEPATVLGISMADDVAFYLFCLVWCALGILFAINLNRTRTGRAFAAIRDQDIAAAMMGISLTRYKVLSFMISSFYAGVAGALMGYQFGYINVDNFDVLLSIEAIAMVILGGMGSIAGAVLGATFLTLLPEAIRSVSDLAGLGMDSWFSTSALEIRGLVYGITIVLFLRFQPEGLIGWWHDLKRYWTYWPFKN